jgi:hypothetical protein|tara:strand:- start:201 stop:626 length:426 start_codon:yes stop_codon:yes gene_type:complete
MKKISKKNVFISILFLFIFFHQINFQFYSKNSYDVTGYLSCPIELATENENIVKVDISTNSEYIESFSVTLYVNSTQVNQILIDRKSYGLSDVFNNPIFVNLNNYNNLDELSKVKISLSGKDKYGNRFKSYCEYTSLVLDK